MLSAPLVPVTLALAVWTAGDPQQTPVVRRVHDLSSARPVAAVQGDGGLQLMPLLVDPDVNGNIERVARTARDTNALVDLLRGMNSAMVESADRELSAINDTQLLVEAPAADQDLIARELAFLEDSFGRPTRIVFDFVTFGPNPGVEGLPTLIAASEVERWVSVAQGHERHDLSILPGERMDVAAERIVSLFLSPSIEIAQRATGFSTQPTNISVGTRIDTAIAPARGGLWLALNLREGRLLGAVESREQSLTSTITTDHESLRVEGPKSRDDVRLANHSMSINTFLPDGKAIVLQSSIGLETHVVFVHQEGGTTPGSYRLPDDLKRAVSTPELALIRIDGLAPPVARASVPDGARVSGARLALIDLGFPLVIAGSMDMHGCEPLFDCFVSVAESTPSLRAGAWLVPLCTTREQLESQLATYAQLTPEPRSMQVRLTLRKGMRDPTVLARGLLPIRGGAESTITLGRESLATAATTVEVAEGATGPSPNVVRLFDGFVVQLTPRSQSNGGTSLEVDAHARWSRDLPRTFDAGTPTLPKLQLQDSDVLDSTRTVVFSKGEAGAKRVTLGNTGSANDALTLEIELTDQR